MDVNSRTPLSRAAQFNAEETINLLIDKKAVIDTLDNNGRTPLSWAAGNGSEVAARALVKAGASPNTKDIRGRTPLDYARIGAGTNTRPRRYQKFSTVIALLEPITSATSELGPFDEIIDTFLVHGPTDEE